MFQLKLRTADPDVVSSTDTSSTPLLSSSPSHPALSSLVESSDVSSPSATFYLPSSDQTKIDIRLLQEPFVKQRHLSGQQDKLTCSALARTTSIASFDQLASRIR